MQIDKNQQLLSEFQQKTCTWCGIALYGRNKKACLCRMCEMGVATNANYY